MSHSSTPTEAVEMSQVEVPMKERISFEPAGTPVVPQEPTPSTTKATKPTKSTAKSRKKDKKKKKDPPPLPPFHIQSVESVLEEFKSSTLGLREEDIAGRVAKYGKNELKGEGGVSLTRSAVTLRCDVSIEISDGIFQVNPFILLLRHLVNGLTIILLIAAILSIVTEQWIETGKKNSQFFAKRQH